MTNPSLILEGVSYILPDGGILFSNLNETFGQYRTGLVGRNGVGKSVLARILAGMVLPTAGRCLRSGNVYYLAQQVTPPANATVATLTGVHQALMALARIERGSSDPADFDAVGERWDLRQRLQATLAQHGLGHLRSDTHASHLSGGEAMRVALVGAWLSDADFMILDEPSNHLDRPQRQALIDRLQRWTRGLLVVSHDRQLLGTMQRIVQLSPQGLRSYGGNYAFYAAAKEHERLKTQQHLEERKLERRREEQAMREQRERQARRQARGNRHGREANQAKVLLDRQKDRNQDSGGKLSQRHSAASELLDQRVREAMQQVQEDAAITLHTVPAAQARRRRVAELHAVQLPFVSKASRSISTYLTGQQRVGIVGPNGCGKTTLLRVMAGRIAPLSGKSNITVQTVYLDQQLATLDPNQTVLQQMREANRVASESEIRLWLAQLNLDPRKIVVSSKSLSGGERLKAALACILYAHPSPRLLLLDEPNNHLDLPSAHALEAMLRTYRGALVVVSHDDAFLNNLGVTHRLVPTEQEWRLEPW